MEIQISRFVLVEHALVVFPPEAENICDCH
jgi:hypothetical protein